MPESMEPTPRELCGESCEPTPYAVKCYQCEPNGDHLVYMDHAEYCRQMMRPDSFWTCPRCGKDAKWSDDNYEKMTPEEPINGKSGEVVEDWQDWSD